MTLDIQPADLAIIQAILREHLPAGAKVWVFGSRAKGNAKKYSDLDLAIRLPGSALTLELLTVLSYAFEESTLPYKVDIVDLATVATDFRCLIEKDSIPLSF